MYSHMKPLPMSPAMLQAWLDNIKTQTRRVVKLDLANWFDPPAGPEDVAAGYPFVEDKYGDSHSAVTLCPYGQPGDGLWVREALVRGADGFAYYRLDRKPVLMGRSHYHLEWPWKVRVLAGRYMPKDCCRYVLWFKFVRVERLQEIGEEDAKAEGVWTRAALDRLCDGAEHDVFECCPTLAFRTLWQSINGKRPSCSWEKNPWVWVLELPSYAEWQNAVGRGWHRRAA